MNIAKSTEVKSGEPEEKVSKLVIAAEFVESVAILALLSLGAAWYFEAGTWQFWTATPLIIYLGFFMAVALRAQDLTVRDAATAKASADAATLRKKFTDAQFLLTDERLDLMKSDKLNEIVLKVLHSATKNEPMAGQALLKMLERRAGKPSTEAAMQLILHHGAFDEEPEDSGAQQRAAG